jgi:hypothetical protein
LVSGDDPTLAGKARKPFHSALWQSDGSKVRRYAPIDFIGRYMDGFFDYAIADEVHELKGDTAQGNALGTLASSAQRIVILTGTLLGGYADELFNILFRLNPRKMLAEGFVPGEAGLRAFSEAYGVLEKVTVIEPKDNVCSEARVTKRVKRRPGASPLLFGRFLLELGAFVSLEDISDALPPYQEEVISVEMDAPLASAYEDLERRHQGGSSGTPRQPVRDQHGHECPAGLPGPSVRIGQSDRLRRQRGYRRAGAVRDLKPAGPGPIRRLREGAPARRGGQD